MSRKTRLYKVAPGDGTCLRAQTTVSNVDAAKRVTREIRTKQTKLALLLAIAIDVGVISIRGFVLLVLLSYQNRTQPQPMLRC
jgi:hypothetical protein